MSADIKVQVTDFIPEFLALMQKGYGDRVFTQTQAAVKSISEMYMATWRGYASGNMIIPGKKPIRSRGPYTRSIKLRTIKNGEAYEIYTNFPYHAIIEEGHGPIDLKPGLTSGPKARTGKKGPYNIVSFRQGVPGTARNNNPMPIKIYGQMLRDTKKADEDKAKGLVDKPGTSKVLKSGPRVENRAYEWGHKFDQKSQYGRRSQRYSGYTWKAGKYAGMVRMDTSSKKKRHSEYRTFRVVSKYGSKPNSWIVPPEEPKPIRQATVDFVGSSVDIESVLRTAIEKDIS